MLLSLFYSIYTEITIGRSLSYVSMTCQLKDEVQSKLQLALFLAPSLVVCMVCTVKIWLCLRLHTQRIIDVTLRNDDTRNARRTHPMRRMVNSCLIAIRLIVMVSGVFLVTLIPSILLRQIIFSQGVTWLDIETRANYTAAIAMRLELIVGSIVFATLNPIIYYSVDKQLYQQLKEALGLRIGNSPISSDQALPMWHAGITGNPSVDFQL